MKKGDRIKAELDSIRNTSKGILHAALVVKWAEAHPKSALYAQFQWNDVRAAAEYRLWQARQIIQIHVVDAAGNPEMVSLTIDRAEGGGYRTISDVLSSKRLTQIMLKDALDELERTQMKYERVQQLTGVWKAVAKVKSTKRRRR